MESKYVVEYKPSRVSQVFLKYYLGYPLSYFPLILDNGCKGYMFVGVFPLNGSFSKSIEKSDVTEVMVERITKIVDEFESRVNRDLVTIEEHRLQKQKSDELVEQERQLFKAIANREMVPKPKIDEPRIIDLGSTKKDKEIGLFKKLIGNG